MRIESPLPLDFSTSGSGFGSGLASAFAGFSSTAVTGIYTPKGFLRVTTNPPMPANITVNGEVANAYGVWTSKEPGAYDVCFGAVEGSDTPRRKTSSLTLSAPLKLMRRT